MLLSARPSLNSNIDPLNGELAWEVPSSPSPLLCSSVSGCPHLVSNLAACRADTGKPVPASQDLYIRVVRLVAKISGMVGDLGQIFDPLLELFSLEFKILCEADNH